VPLIQTFVPIPIVGTIAGALLPTLTSLVGGSLGGNLGAGMSFKAALKALDPVAIAGQAAGSTIGAMLGSMIPIPVVGTMLGSIVGGIVGEKLFTGIAKLLGYRKNQQQQPSSNVSLNNQANARVAESNLQIQKSSAELSKLRLPDTAEKIPYNKMDSSLKQAKDSYESAYKAYVKAVTSGDQKLAQSRLKEFSKARSKYEKALKSVTR
jgi:hypothetical protein